MKKYFYLFIMVVIILLICIMTFATSSETTIILKGDINLDGKVNGMDLLLMKQHIMDTEGKVLIKDTPEYNNADMNDDGIINGLDLLLLKKFIMNNENSTTILESEKMTNEQNITEKSTQALISGFIPIEPFVFSFENEDYSIIYDKVFELTGNSDLSEFQIEKSASVIQSGVVKGYKITLFRYIDSIKTDSRYSFLFQDDECNQYSDNTKLFIPENVKPLRQPTEEEKLQVYNMALSQIPSWFSEYVIKDQHEKLFYKIDEDELIFGINVIYGPSDSDARSGEYAEIVLLR